ncbi:MAG TPA: hypothetical protein VK789_35380 [Bryobacteraceae bacterium]|jgi:hypothetical protein|nr:hypothetical protein [Bryobacteraceae bacterium]
MFGKILKGFAVAAGVGFAIGFGSGVGRRRSLEKKTLGNAPGDNRLNERLDRFESRLTAIEARPSPAAVTREADRRITSQAEDIEGLRLQMSEYRQRIAVDIENIEKRVADVTKAIPSMLESIITPKVDDLRLRLRSEMQQSVTASLTTFERAIDDKVSDRIAALERAMLEQSALVTALSQRAVESDLNLQRLISAVERLCDRPGLGPDAHAVAA